MARRGSRGCLARTASPALGVRRVRVGRREAVVQWAPLVQWGQRGRRERVGRAVLRVCRGDGGRRAFRVVLARAALRAAPVHRAVLAAPVVRGAMEDVARLGGVAPVAREVRVACAALGVHAVQRACVGAMERAASAAGPAGVDPGVCVAYAVSVGLPAAPATVALGAEAVVVRVAHAATAAVTAVVARAGYEAFGGALASAGPSCATATRCGTCGTLCMCGGGGGTGTTSAGTRSSTTTATTSTTSTSAT